MKKITIIKRKEVLLSILSILFLCLGFFSYNRISKNSISNNQNDNTLGEAILVSSNSVDEENDQISEIEESDNNINLSETSEKLDDDLNNYFLKAKMDRDNIYSQMLEIYEKMLENSEISNDQKVIAQNEITKISSERKTIALTENLIMLKGFENVVIFKNENEISVIVKSDVLLPENVSQIQNIIEREFKIDAKNITITNK